MLRSQLPFVVLLTWLAQPLELAGQIQVPHADSAHYTQARALCGPLADDTTVLDPLWPPSGSVVSARFPGFEGLKLLPSTTVPDYPSHLRKQRVQGTVIVAAVVDTTGRDRKSTRLNSSHRRLSRMPSSA